MDKWSEESIVLSMDNMYDRWNNIRSRSEASRIGKLGGLGGGRGGQGGRDKTSRICWSIEVSDEVEERSEESVVSSMEKR